MSAAVPGRPLILPSLLPAVRTLSLPAPAECTCRTSPHTPLHVQCLVRPSSRHERQPAAHNVCGRASRARGRAWAPPRAQGARPAPASWALGNYCWLLGGECCLWRREGEVRGGQQKPTPCKLLLEAEAAWSCSQGSWKEPARPLQHIGAVCMCQPALPASTANSASRTAPLLLRMIAS